MLNKGQKGVKKLETNKKEEVNDAESIISKIYKQGYSYAWIASKLGDFSEQTIRNWATGKFCPSPPKLRKLKLLLEELPND